MSKLIQHGSLFFLSMMLTALVGMASAQAALPEPPSGWDCHTEVEMKMECHVNPDGGITCAIVKVRETTTCHLIE